MRRACLAPPNSRPLRSTSTWPGNAPSSRAASASRNAAVSLASARSDEASRSRSGASATRATVPVGVVGALRCAAMADRTGWVWHERYAWHDARGLMDSAPPEALFEPEPSLESGVTKRRFRNLVDASGLLGAPRRDRPAPGGRRRARVDPRPGVHRGRPRAERRRRRRRGRLDAVRPRHLRRRRARGRRLHRRRRRRGRRPRRATPTRSSARPATTRGRTAAAATASSRTSR